MKEMEVAGVQVDRTSNVPVVVLRELDAPHRLLVIHVGGPEAAAIAMSLAGHVPPRPLAHDVMADLVLRLDAHVDAVQVVALRNGTFVAELAVRGPRGRHLVDSRASDAIAIAMRVGAPVLVDEVVLSSAGTWPVSLDADDGLDADLDQDLDDDLDLDLDLDLADDLPADVLVEAFRLFLDEVHADDFAR